MSINPLSLQNLKVNIFVLQFPQPLNENNYGFVVRTNGVNMERCLVTYYQYSCDLYTVWILIGIRK